MKIKLILFVMFCCLLPFSCIKEDETTGNIIKVNDKLPDFKLTNTSGESISTVSLKNKFSVIMFFNTNCSDCQRELPKLEKLYQYYRNNPDFELIAIARGENEDEVSSYFEKNNLTFKFFADTNREVYSLFATTTIPRVYLSDTDLIVRWVQVETINWTELEDVINDLLPKSTNPN